MAGNDANVSREGLQAALTMCRTAQHELDITASRLLKKYHDAGADGWRDEKYLQLGGVVEECCSQLRGPLPKLAEAENILQKLLNALDNYENS